MADLTQFKGNDTYEFNLRHPVTGEPLDILIGVYSCDSRQYNAAKHASRNDTLRRGAQTSEAAQDGGTRILVACVYRLDNCLIEGVEIGPNEKDLRRLFAAHPWTREQIDAAIHSRANFLPTAPTD